jgi:hypothetical protein
MKQKSHGMRKMSQGLKYFLRHLSSIIGLAKVRNIKGEITKPQV